MIILFEQGNERAVFTDVTRIEEQTKPSLMGGYRHVVTLWNGDKRLMGDDTIDLSDTKITLLPNAEKE